MLDPVEAEADGGEDGGARANAVDALVDWLAVLCLCAKAQQILNEHVTYVPGSHLYFRCLHLHV